MNEIWVVGAAGRVGRALVTVLTRKSQRTPLVLLGRSEAPLRELAAALGGSRVSVTESLDAIASEIARGKPAVVVNTVGPFTKTAPALLSACAPGCHYVDVANDLGAVPALLAQDAAAVATRQCRVTGAGWGLLATESLVLKLCEGHPTPERVRVDMVAATEGGGVIGEALAATIVEALAEGGRHYEDGRLVRSAVGLFTESFTFPDGKSMVTGSMALADLEAAHRASHAPFVVAGSNLAPKGAFARAAVSGLSSLLSVKALRGFMTRRLAAVRVQTPENTGPATSWARARVEWAGGETRQAWLRAGEGMAFTGAVIGEIALRLANQEGRPGAFTPGALFGAKLAEECGGTFLLEPKAAR